MSYAKVEEGNDGNFYITPLRARLNGVSFETRDEAQYISDAVNIAYKAGRRDIQDDLREMLGFEAATDSSY